MESSCGQTHRVSGEVATLHRCARLTLAGNPHVAARGRLSLAIYVYLEAGYCELHGAAVDAAGESYQRCGPHDERRLIRFLTPPHPLRAAGARRHGGMAAPGLTAPIRPDFLSVCSASERSSALCQEQGGGGNNNCYTNLTSCHALTARAAPLPRSTLYSCSNDQRRATGPNLQKRWGHVLIDPARSGREAPRAKRALRKVFSGFRCRLQSPPSNLLVSSLPALPPHRHRRPPA
jgi:hypothetical protein